jgi:hypothetical protein
VPGGFLPANGHIVAEQFEHFASIGNALVRPASRENGEQYEMIFIRRMLGEMHRADCTLKLVNRGGIEVAKSLGYDVANYSPPLPGISCHTVHGIIGKLRVPELNRAFQEIGLPFGLDRSLPCRASRELALDNCVTIVALYPPATCPLIVAEIRRWTRIFVDLLSQRPTSRPRVLSLGIENRRNSTSLSPIRSRASAYSANFSSSSRGFFFTTSASPR